MSVNQMSFLGIALLGSLIVGKLAHRLRLPKVSGFLLLGLALGPSGAGVINAEMIEQFKVLSRLAIALVLFDIGGEFDIREIRRLEGRPFVISLVEGGLTAVGVGTVMWLLGAPWPVALILGALAMDTSPTVTILVIKEFQGKGPFTQLIFGVVASDAVLTIALFWSVMGFLELRASGNLLSSLWLTSCAVGGAIVVGYCLGALLDRVGRSMIDRAELMLLTFGVLLCVVGFAPDFGFSTMLATIVTGAVVANRHEVRGRLFEVLKPLTGILYTLFFVLAGASLHVELVRNMGALGLGYLVTRLICKLVGGVAGVLLVGLHRTHARWVPLALVPHAGVAIGLTLTLDRIHPEFSALVKVVALSAVFFFEIVGPFLTRMSLRLAGEDRDAVDTYDLDVLASGQESPDPEEST